MTQHRVSRSRLAAFGLAAMVALAPGGADARLGGGFSFGSRGARTWSAPPITSTAPRTASPFDRSTAPSSGFTRPGYSPGGLFGGGGFGRGLLGGLVGAGLLGMLFGNGMFGGLGGGSSMIGLLLQLALLYFGVKFAMNWFASRRQMAGAPGAGFGAPSGFTPTGFGGGAPQPNPTVPITLPPENFQAFERLLDTLQSAYGREDVAALRQCATPEMASVLERQIADNARRGVVNRVSNARLLQGDLSEAWREGGEEWATVAMRFTILDVTQERATGRIVAGDPNHPTEATELWTFRRAAGAGPNAWSLSAVQQA